MNTTKEKGYPSFYCGVELFVNCLETHTIPFGTVLSVIMGVQLVGLVKLVRSLIPMPGMQVLLEGEPVICAIGIGDYGTLCSDCEDTSSCYI